MKVRTNANHNTGSFFIQEIKRFYKPGESRVYANLPFLIVNIEHSGIILMVQTRRHASGRNRFPRIEQPLSANRRSVIGGHWIN